MKQCKHTDGWGIVWIVGGSGRAHKGHYEAKCGGTDVSFHNDTYYSLFQRITLKGQDEHNECLALRVFVLLPLFPLGLSSISLCLQLCSHRHSVIPRRPVNQKERTPGCLTVL